MAQHFAEFFRELGTPVIPWFHELDIPKGVPWAQDLWRQLQDPQLGIVIVTRESRNSPWLLFEAGMLAQNLGNARVFTVLLGVEEGEVGEPLSHFQSTQLVDEKDMYSLVQALNGCCKSPLGGGELQRAFSEAWPGFFETIRGLPEVEEQTSKGDAEHLLEAYCKESNL